MLDQWTGDVVSDEGLVQYAAAEGYVAVVVMGRNALAREDLLDAARAAGIALVITHSDDPVRADEELSSHLKRIGHLVTPGTVIIAQSAAAKVADTGTT